MLNLQEFRSKAKGLPDLLTYAALIEPGIILQKDGSLLASWEFTGLDTASATHDELAFVSLQVSNALKHLGTGFMLHVDAIRTTKKAYPKTSQGFFKHRITQRIDDERRAYFGADLCYSTITALTVTYMPSYNITGKNKKHTSIALNKGLGCVSKLFFCSLELRQRAIFVQVMYLRVHSYHKNSPFPCQKTKLLNLETHPRLFQKCPHGN